MPEILLHYIWEHCLWAGYQQFTTDGRPIAILAVGQHNRDAGPDYSHARIRIGEQEWVGNIEIHVNAGDWYRHMHHTDRAYDNVILHVVCKADKQVYNSQGEPIPQCELQYPHDHDYLSELIAAAQQMDSAAGRIGCAQKLLSEPQLLSDGWRQVLLLKRLECKRHSIEHILEITHGSWEHALYISLARNFGFHTNSTPFEELAISTPLAYLLKHRDNLFQLTAMLLGQAGLLPDDQPEYRKEYEFLQKKFSLVPLDGSIWKHSRMRPQNSPELRIRQFAQLIHQSEFLLSKILEASDLSALVRIFQLEQMPIGRASIDILLINTVIPYRYAHSMAHSKNAGMDDAIRLMQQIAPENNVIIRQWRMLGQQVNSAADTQALIHLYQNYCQPHECVNCEVGYKIFFSNTRQLLLDLKD